MRVVSIGVGFLAMITIGSCGSAPLTRTVIDRDIGAWSFRRYQQVHDYEFVVPGNAGVGHTAAYVRRSQAPHDGPAPTLRVATAFVTVYERPTSLAAEVLERLRALAPAYESTVIERSGQWVHSLVGADGDVWLLWVSRSRIVKLGVSSGPIPDEMIAAYLSQYPSDLTRVGRARDGAASAGSSQRESREDEEIESLEANTLELEASSDAGAPAAR